MALISRDRLKLYDTFALGLVRGLKKQIVAVFLLFGLGAAIGYTDIFHTNAIMMSILTALVSSFAASEDVALFGRIFLHNVMATLISMYSGIVLAVFPVVSIVFNGMVIGFFFQAGNGLSSMPNHIKLLSLIPHGIFEIPAAILALAMGIKLGSWPLSAHKSGHIKTTFTEVSLGYLKLILPLLLIAAMIETIGIEAIRYSLH